MSRDPIPIACSLSTADAARQMMRWNDLGLQASRIESVDGGFAATFPVDLAHDVEALAAREAECCEFLSISTTRTDREVRLEITAAKDAGPVVEALSIAIGR